MTDYFNFADLKGAIIGLVTGIAGFFICLRIQRYLSNRNIKSLNRRIKESEAEKVKLDNLAKSDRALIIHGFQGVFAMIAILCMILALQSPFFMNRDPEFFDLRGLGQLLLWFIPAFLCVAIVWSLQRVADYPKSLEKIDERIAKLRDRLSGK